MMNDNLFSKELHIACLAVQRASLATRQVYAAADKGVSEKLDASLVTVADFAAQALLISAIHHNFPEDGFLGEETAMILRGNVQLQDRVWHVVSTAKLDDDPAGNELLAVPASKGEMLDIIDLGRRMLPDQTGQRFWILDPVDGTSTFLQGKQYAVCLALVAEGAQKVGVLGCPNFAACHPPIMEDSANIHGPGFMLSAVAGHGAHVRPMSNKGSLEPARMVNHLHHIKTAQGIRFIDSSTHPAISATAHAEVARELGVPWPGTELWAMQVKYAALSLGQGDVVIRMPPSKSFRPYVWDHAGGQLIFEEAGGKLTDINGRAFDFTVGLKLDNNYGLVGAPRHIHDQILRVVQRVAGGTPF
ncbi:hypothetical protein NQ176_g6996 [Zarea fungicola]|uniref:Uncharacterized protein n=1 Tax=Zarea fungicola TaxID=93591 RepID=A0ACC1N0C1_9HYPO|nr:hypothetical protein NQ176_g6996 [Lecanicillium fungicola]